MVTYTLSWEEFLAFQQESRPSATYSSIVAVVIPPLIAALVFLHLLESILSEENFLPTSALWLLSIFLFIAAFTDFSVSGRRWRHRTVEGLRDEYEQYQSGERIFEFDEEKAVIRTQSSRAEHLWRNLRYVTEWPDVITLLAKGQPLVIIPKRVFTPEERDRLRNIAYRPELAWRSYLNPLDFIVTEASTRWRSHPYTASGAHLAALFSFAVILKDFDNSTRTVRSGEWWVAGMFVLVGLTAEIWHLLAVYIGSISILRQPWMLGVSDAGVYMKTSKTESFVSWDYFKKYQERMRCYLLYINSSQYYPWPKHHIPAEHKLRVHQLLERHLKTQDSEKAAEVADTTT